MKWEPLFAHLLKLFIRTDKSKKEESETTALVTDDGKPYKPGKNYGGQNMNMTNKKRSS